jgi:hypothetical protein
MRLSGPPPNSVGTTTRCDISRTGAWSLQRVFALKVRVNFYRPTSAESADEGWSDVAGLALLHELGAANS